MRGSFLLTFAGSLILSSTSALAQQASSEQSANGMVAVGLGIVPEFEGAEDVRLLPFVFGEFGIGETTIQARGQGLRVDLVADPRFAIGPVIGARLPREDADGAVGLLPEVDLAIEAGGYVGYRLGGDRLGQGSLQLELSLVHDVSSTHSGLLATASASYGVLRTADFFLTLEAQTTWADEDYTQTYFGIDDVGAEASGLSPYRPGSGFSDLGVGVASGYWFSRRFGLMARAGARYLVGDAADSPVVDEGSRWQPSAGIALAYRF